MMEICLEMMGAMAAARLRLDLFALKQLMQSVLDSQYEGMAFMSMANSEMMEIRLTMMGEVAHVM
jgi:hypothetical protein